MSIDDSSPAPATIASRLRALRAILVADGLDYFLVPSTDTHQSEYVPDPWQRRAWLTGFTGSMGDALVGRDRALLFADSRYWIQGEQELAGTPWELVRLGAEGIADLVGTLKAAGAGLSVGFDPRLHTLGETDRLRAAVEGAGSRLVAVDVNPVDRVWEDRPALPATAVILWPEVYSGASVASKLGELRASMVDKGAAWLVVATLDELAWCFNIRGRDVAYNPISIGWGLIGLESATLFSGPGKCDGETVAALSAAGVEVADYEAFESALQDLRGTVWLDPSSTNQWIASSLDSAQTSVHRGPSPVLRPRAVKNAIEIEGMRRAHVRDGVAVTRFLAWLESSWRQGVDELAAAKRLKEFRAEGERFQGLSFETIAGFGPNGAIVHYRSTPATSRTVDDSSLFLLDSGGQYLDGTTDITRTLHLGTPTAAEREAYTRVLRGHLAFARAVFPRGTTGTHLDVLARGPLWDVAQNYGHGTGHGVGCYLSVHQGPHRVSPAFNKVPLEPGMILSNEPGFYVAGEFGIRVENLVVVRPHTLAGPFGDFFAFEDLTLAPHCRALIEPSLLNAAELAQLDAYHRRVRETLMPLVGGDAAAFLERETAPLSP